MANTEAVIRSVVVVGFQGVQALDLVGPFDVFTGATVCLASQGRGDDGYEVSMASVDARPVSTGAGLELVAKRLPDPREPIDTVVLPGGFGTGTARQDARLIEWIKAVAPNARRVISVCNEAARRQLEETDDTVTVIASRCGFGTAETMRRNFVRRVAISPAHYRKTFA